MTPSVGPTKFLRRRCQATQASFRGQTLAYSQRQQRSLDRTAARNEEFERR